MEIFAKYIKAVIWVALIAISVIVFLSGGTMQSLVIFILGGIVVGTVFRAVPVQG